MVRFHLILILLTLFSTMLLAIGANMSKYDGIVKIMQKEQKKPHPHQKQRKQSTSKRKCSFEPQIKKKILLLPPSPPPIPSSQLLHSEKLQQNHEQRNYLVDRFRKRKNTIGLNIIVSHLFTFWLCLLLFHDNVKVTVTSKDNSIPLALSQEQRKQQQGIQGVEAASNLQYYSSNHHHHHHHHHHNPSSSSYRTTNTDEEEEKLIQSKKRRDLDDRSNAFAMELLLKYSLIKKKTTNSYNDTPKSSSSTAQQRTRRRYNRHISDHNTPNNHDASTMSSSRMNADNNEHNRNNNHKACSFYIWNGWSALIHVWCNNLINDCIYEGKGGVKFVRIRPGSILQLLYPWYHNSSTNQCLLCGGTFHDHCTLYWYNLNGLYNPFDLLVSNMEKQYTTTKSTIMVADNNQQHQSKKNVHQRNKKKLSTSFLSNNNQKYKKKSSHQLKKQPMSQLDDNIDDSNNICEFVYHRHYVKDISDDALLLSSSSSAKQSHQTKDKQQQSYPYIIRKVDISGDRSSRSTSSNSNNMPSNAIQYQVPVARRHLDSNDNYRINEKESLLTNLKDQKMYQSKQRKASAASSTTISTMSSVRKSNQIASSYDTNNESSQLQLQQKQSQSLSSTYFMIRSLILQSIDQLIIYEQFDQSKYNIQSISKKRI